MIPPAQAATPCPHCRKKKGRNLLFDVLPTLNCDESKSKKRAYYRAKRTTTDEVANMIEAIWDVNWTLSAIFSITLAHSNRRMGTERMYHEQFNILCMLQTSCNRKASYSHAKLCYRKLGTTTLACFHLLQCGHRLPCCRGIV